jgi:hypothetical protein
MGKAKKKRAQKRQENRSKIDPMGKMLAAEENSKQAQGFLHGVSFLAFVTLSRTHTMLALS